MTFIVCILATEEQPTFDIDPKDLQLTMTNATDGGSEKS